MGAPPEGWAGLFDVHTDLLLSQQSARDPEPAPAARAARQRFLERLPPGYAEKTAPEVAARDWLEISRLLALRPSPAAGDGGVGAAHMALSPGRAGAPGDFRLRRTALSRAELSSLLRAIESFGLVAEEAVPWHFALGSEGGDVFIDDVGLRVGTPVAAPGFELGAGGSRLVDALTAAIGTLTELSVLNRLVVGAGLSWREVNLLHAYCAYRQAVGGPRAAERADLMTQALVAFPAAAAVVVGLFRGLFGPGSGAAADGARSDLRAALAAVPDLQHDEALRELVALVEATTRTNWALERETISLKFASRSVPFLPPPLPLTEVFVWCPGFEGLHLRFGPVARGGIRWSDRRADLRGEVLGLARAQVKKNALIVPTGAKGAFVLHDEPRDRAERAKAGRSAYCAFIGALLDVTDNLVDEKVLRPEGVVCRDGDDPYLVVAPDKGTGAFSDLANGISAEKGYWLGDAFASGGSHGYDHKALGITARGAWLAVQRHFRALAMDAQRDPLRVVGVGDMSGDVFGNGMLQSRSICLVAAFDHRHVFIDPAPDAERSFAERERLSRLERSSWQDYDLGAASPGAAVYLRRAKQVELSAEVAGALGIGAGPISPPQLVRAVLQAPADLLFFGGVGTFVKAFDERDVDVDDSANDDVRVDARHLRARVITEGANLAITQRARASYSRRGGRVNTDFVDNSAGVAMSDREVNLKVLLGVAVARGRLHIAGRNRLLKAEGPAVADAVLAGVARGLVALDGAAASSAADLPAYGALIEDLEHAGLLNREVEALPTEEEMSRRQQAGAGLSRPELAVLFAYARSELARSIESSSLAGEEALMPCVLRYFPPGVREGFSDLVPEHPLYHQLLSCELANEIVDRMGALWAHELAVEAGRELYEVAGAYWAARQVMVVATNFADVDDLGWSLSPAGEEALRGYVVEALDRLSRCYLGRRGPLRPGEVIDRDRPYAMSLERAGAWPDPHQGELLRLGVPAEVADRAQRLALLASVGELGEAARAAGRPLEAAVAACPVLEDGLGLGSLLGALRQRPAPDRWERWQLHALADDLARSRAEALAQCLGRHPLLEGQAAAREWLGERPAAALRRASRLAHQVEVGAPPSLALIALAVRTVGDAVDAR
ncbi:MAG: NAD-glutamate dehydrogenase domain-containing protein [Acidimicrobiales bacterium]